MVDAEKRRLLFLEKVELIQEEAKIRKREAVGHLIELFFSIPIIIYLCKDYEPLKSIRLLVLVPIGIFSMWTLYDFIAKKRWRSFSKIELTLLSEKIGIYNFKEEINKIVLERRASTDREMNLFSFVAKHYYKMDPDKLEQQIRQENKSAVTDTM